MVISEWTRSIKAVRELPVAENTTPGVNTTRCVAFFPLIAVSPFAFTISVTHFEWQLWCCGHLGLYVGMGSFDTHVHWHSNATGDAVNISPCIPSACLQNGVLSLQIIHMIPTRQIYVAIDNPSLVLSISCLTNSSYLWNWVCTANNVSHTEMIQTKHCRCLSHLYKFRGGIKLTWVYMFCGERQS